MMQMRWFHYNDDEEPVLQYRQLIDNTVVAGFRQDWMPSKMEWTDWMDVPHTYYEKKLGQNEDTNNTFS
jgi:hypothetical protein